MHNRSQAKLIRVLKNVLTNARLAFGWSRLWQTIQNRVPYFSDAELYARRFTHCADTPAPTPDSGTQSGRSCSRSAPATGTCPCPAHTHRCPHTRRTVRRAQSPLDSRSSSRSAGSRTARSACRRAARCCTRPGPSRTMRRRSRADKRTGPAPRSGRRSCTSDCRRLPTRQLGCGWGFGG